MNVEPKKQSIDPTANVIALVEANAEAARALRDADIKFNDVQHAHLKDISNLRAGHARELNVAESKRIDAIRAVDVNAVAVASERATQQASVLATQVTASADALRNLVAETARTMATSSEKFTAALTERLASVERAQYEGKGRQGVTDPQLEKLTLLVEALARSRDTSVGKSAGISMVWAVVLGAGSLIGTLIGIAGAGVAVVMFLTK